MVELKPCPACGSKIATPVLEYDVKFPQLGYVRCREITCGLKTGLFADGGRHAVEIWNSIPRTDDARGVGKWITKENGKVWWYECSCCGTRPLKSRWADEETLSCYCPSCGARMEVNE